MAPITLSIVLDEGAVTRKIKFDSGLSVQKVYEIVKDKVNVPPGRDEYALFLRSADDNLSGVWLEAGRTLDYYMLVDGDSLDYICKIQNLKVRMLDGTLKTFKVDQTRCVGDLMMDICGRLGITNHDEYGLCYEQVQEEQVPAIKTGTLTLKRNKQPKERDAAMKDMSTKLNTDDNVEWLDQRCTLRQLGVEPNTTLLLKRRLFFSDCNVNTRDPVQLNLLYVQTRDAILTGRHLVTEAQALLCKSRWVNMRDTMRRKIRDRLRKPHQHIYRYKYEDEISFVLPYFKESVTNTDEFHDFLDDPCEVEMPSEVFVQNNIDLHETKPYFSKRLSDSSRDLNETVYQELNPSDPLDVFLLAIGSTLRKFNPLYLNQAKSKIFQIVQEYELEQITGKDDQGQGSEAGCGKR